MSTDSGDEYVNVYITGVFDAEQAFRCQIEKNTSSRTGYRILPKVEISNRSREMANVVSNWLRDIGIHARVEQSGSKRPRYKVSVTRRDDVKDVLSAIIPYLIVHDGEAQLLLEEIIPRLEVGSPMTKERFVETVGYIDELEAGPSPNRKYTLEFFREEWGIEDEEATD